MDSRNVWLFAVALLGLGWLALWNFWLLAGARTEVEDWANSQGYRLVYWRRLYFFIGEPVYRIVVEDGAGRKRTAIIRAPSIISTFFGFRREPKVRWLDQA
jgi:hypothetical protein